MRTTASTHRSGDHCLALVGVNAQDRSDANAQASMKAMRPAVPGVHGLVTSAHPLASMAGSRILLDGGNAFDRAVAVAAVPNVVEPQSSSIAGCGFATLYDKKTGQVHSLAMAGAAPRGLRVSEMTPETLNAGIKAAVVPGNIGGLIAMLEPVRIEEPGSRPRPRHRVRGAGTSGQRRLRPRRAQRSTHPVGSGSIRIRISYKPGAKSHWRSNAASPLPPSRPSRRWAARSNQATETITAGADPRRAGYAMVTAA